VLRAPCPCVLPRCRALLTAGRLVHARLSGSGGTLCVLLRLAEEKCYLRHASQVNGFDADDALDFSVKDSQSSGVLTVKGDISGWGTMHLYGFSQTPNILSVENTQIGEQMHSLNPCPNFHTTKVSVRLL